MPHIVVKCWPGRTEQQKQKLAERIASKTAQIMEADISDVSVGIEDVQPERWDEDVVQKEIPAKRDTLYKLPGYISKE